MPGDESILASIATFGEGIEGTARDMPAAAEAEQDDGDSPGGALRKAQDFLINELVTGAVAVKKLQALARDAGQSWRTIKRAKQALRIVAAKGGMESGWTWRLPEGDQEGTKGSNPESMDPFANVGPLWDKNGEVTL